VEKRRNRRQFSPRCGREISAGERAQPGALINLRQRAFAGTGRTEQDDPPGFAERLARGHFATGLATFEPRDAAMFWHQTCAVIFWKKSVGIHAAIIIQPSDLPRADGQFPQNGAVFGKNCESEIIRDEVFSGNLDGY
jgi:hypothetical protein